MTGRRKRLLEQAEQALHELRREQLLGKLRGWRDQAGKDRALLFGQNSGRVDGKPHFCLLLERTPDGSPRVRKFRGRLDVDAISQALQALESES